VDENGETVLRECLSSKFLRAHFTADLSVCDLHVDTRNLNVEADDLRGCFARKFSETMEELLRFRVGAVGEFRCLEKHDCALWSHFFSSTQPSWLSK